MMNIKSFLYGVKKYGLKGILDYIVRLPKVFKLRFFLKKTMRKEAPVQGVTIIACLDSPSSLSKVMRDLAIRLKESDIPYQTFNIPCSNPIPFDELRDFLTPRKDFCLNKYTHILTIQGTFDVPDKRCTNYSIQFWEFEDGFIENCPSVLRTKKILALSNFNQYVFHKILPPGTIVEKILYPFQFPRNRLVSQKITRSKYGISPDDFVVFFNFDFASSYFRKNPEGILKAFATSLANKPNAKIVFKTMRAKKCKHMSDRLHSFAKEYGIENSLITIDDFIPQEDLINLTNACDVYMSLHRGEGFGLGIAEAMSLGKAVIVTNYSAVTEFCNKANAILIPYKLIPVEKHLIDVDAYQHVTVWAEPDLAVAAEALLTLYQSPALRTQLGNNAKSSIDEYFSRENFKKHLQTFLNMNK